VDDNQEFRQALKELLETEFSAQVIAEASNGNEFLALKNHHLANIIIMDLMMPEKSGLEQQNLSYGNLHMPKSLQLPCTMTKPI